MPYMTCSAVLREEILRDDADSRNIQKNVYFTTPVGSTTRLHGAQASGSQLC